MSVFDGMVWLLPTMITPHRCTYNITLKPANEIKEHQNMIHYAMLVTKESNNKIHDNDTTYFMGKEPILH